MTVLARLPLLQGEGWQKALESDSKLETFLPWTSLAWKKTYDAVSFKGVSDWSSVVTSGLGNHKSLFQMVFKIMIQNHSDGRL